MAATDVVALFDLARDEDVDLVLVGPEAPLAAGIVDIFRGAGVPVFGPTRRAAEIETSKRFSKELMLRAGVPTASRRRARTSSSRCRCRWSSTPSSRSDGFDI